MNPYRKSRDRTVSSARWGLMSWIARATMWTTMPWRSMWPWTSMAAASRAAARERS